jgi:hypothetical protein
VIDTLPCKWVWRSLPTVVVLSSSPCWSDCPGGRPIILIYREGSWTEVTNRTGDVGGVEW